jgi:hypothetical protein
MTSRYTLLHRLHALGAALLLAVAACGGGVETGGTGPTGSAYVEGPVSGFGSIIVGGIRFDDSAARIEDADGSARSRDDLRLGMVVEVESGRIGDDGSGGRGGVASRVRLGAQLLGPVTALDVTAGRLFVLGQQVRLTPATVLGSPSGGAGALRLGDIVEVHGFFDVNVLAASYVATRVELRSTTPAAFRVRGVARDVDQNARTLRIGAQQFDLAAIGVPAGLIDGAFVRLVVQTAQVGGRWPVSSAAVETRRLDDRDEAEVEGLITAFTSATRFSVNGVAVNASGAGFPQGNAGLGLGVRIRVKGRVAAATLVANVVELRSDEDAFNEGIELRGTLSGLNRTTATFVLRGVTIFYGTVPPPEYVSPASESGLADRQCVRVRARLDADRTRVLATRIEFRDSCT